MATPANAANAVPAISIASTEADTLLVELGAAAPAPAPFGLNDTEGVAEFVMVEKGVCSGGTEKVKVADEVGDELVEVAFRVI
jgi:hypothetical protein